MTSSHKEKLREEFAKFVYFSDEITNILPAEIVTQIADYWLSKMEEHSKEFRERVGTEMLIKDVLNNMWVGKDWRTNDDSKAEGFIAAINAVLSLHESLEE